MKLLIKIFLTFVLLSASVLASADWWGNPTPNVYLCQGEECSIEQGALLARDSINTIETERSLSDYVIEIVRYLSTFLTLIGVIIIIYAGFTILTSGGEEEKLKKARTMIFYALIGVTLIWLAYSIMIWFVSVLDLSIPAASPVVPGP